MYYRNRNVKPAPWYTELKIGSDIKISISGYKKVSFRIYYNEWFLYGLNLYVHK